MFCFGLSLGPSNLIFRYDLSPTPFACSFRADHSPASFACIFCMGSFNWMNCFDLLARLFRLDLSLGCFAWMLCLDLSLGCFARDLSLGIQGFGNRLKIPGESDEDTVAQDTRGTSRCAAPCMLCKEIESERIFAQDLSYGPRSRSEVL